LIVAIPYFYKLLAIHPIDPLQVPNMPKRDAWPVNSAIEYGVWFMRLGSKERIRSKPEAKKQCLDPLGMLKTGCFVGEAGVKAK
jgi:hypothetical protein